MKEEIAIRPIDKLNNPEIMNPRNLLIHKIRDSKSTMTVNYLPNSLPSLVQYQIFQEQIVVFSSKK